MYRERVHDNKERNTCGNVNDFECILARNIDNNDETMTSR